MIGGAEANIEEEPSDKRKKLFGDYDQKKELSGQSIDNFDLESGAGANVNTEPNEEEKAAMARFKQNDAELDDILDRINVGLGELKVKAGQIGNEIDNQ